MMALIVLCRTFNLVLVHCICQHNITWKIEAEPATPESICLFPLLVSCVRLLVS